jgi:hypothetical protein
MFRRLAAVLAAMGLMLVMAAPALAVTEDLHQDTPIAWNDEGVEVECEDGDNVPSGMVLWHFVAHTTTNDFLLTADFNVGDQAVNETTYDVTGAGDPESTPDKIVDAYELHWDVITPLGTLESASITGTGTVNAGGFNLSHVCPNPGEEIPESPASALLVLTAAILGMGLVGWKMRQGVTAA